MAPRCAVGRRTRGSSTDPRSVDLPRLPPIDRASLERPRLPRPDVTGGALIATQRNRRHRAEDTTPGRAGPTSVAGRTAQPPY